MAPLVLEGETLGARQKHYNHLLNDAITKNAVTIPLPKICYEEPDIDNLFKIDIASHNRDVDYILEVLKCEDLLYVSRAIKQSKWLITENQYAHIINPKHLYDELFSHMTVRAKNKLMLEIRLNLKNESRVEEFCDYLMLLDLQLGFKWLPYCSIPFIQRIIEKHAKNIPASLIRRLSEKSITFLDIYCRNSTDYQGSRAIQAAMFLLNKNTTLFLDILKSHMRNNYINVGPKYTKIIMKNCPDRIFNNLEDFKYAIHIRTFAKFVKKEEIKEFLMKIVKNKNMQHWKKYENIQHFIKRLPTEGKFEFIKQIFIDKIQIDDNDDSQDDEICPSQCKIAYYCASPRDTPYTSANIYRWYKFAPFCTAFEDLKKLIRTESNPSERHAILSIILGCAGKNMQYIQTLLLYYRDNHINESFKFKIHFVNNILGKINPCTLDPKTWEYLNNIFTSLEVYQVNNNNVQSCVISIILYNISHDVKVPKLIEDKFVFETLKAHQKKLTADIGEKVFQYLYELESFKLNNLTTSKERDFDKAVRIIENILNLLIDWNKNLSDYVMIIGKIKELISVQKNNSWSKDISQFYHMKKDWRKNLFQESLLLNPTPEVCLNVLKHDPKLMKVYETELNIICMNDTVAQRRLLNKVRIFWSESLADFFKSTYFKILENKTNHQAAIFGLTILLPQKQCTELIHKYVPSETKIDWNQQNEVEFSIQKNIAKKMHLARPQPSLSLALLYAKGDFLQYVLPSLNAILYNISSAQARECLPNLLNTPVSLQKHGIRIALAKLNHHELKKIFSHLWNSTKNSSIRATVMTQTFNLLCKQKNLAAINEIWDMFSIFIDNLTTEENKNVYGILTKVSAVPLSIRVTYWIKSYNFLKTLPEKANCTGFINSLKRSMKDIIKDFEPDYIAEIFLDSFDKNFTTQRYEDVSYIATYLLSCENEESQNIRFNKVLLPIFQKAFLAWDKEVNNTYYTRYNINELLNCMFTDFEDLVLNNKLNLPVLLFSNIYKILEESLPIRENYILLTNKKLALDYIKILDNILKNKKHDAYQDSSRSNQVYQWNRLYLEAAPEFGKICLEHLKIDVKKYFPSVYSIFAAALETLFDKFCHSSSSKYATLQEFIECQDFVQGNLLVLQLLPIYVYEEDEKSSKSEILRKLSTSSSTEVQMHYWQYVSNR